MKHNITSKKACTKRHDLWDGEKETDEKTVEDVAKTEVTDNIARQTIEDGTARLVVVIIMKKIVVFPATKP